MPGARRGLEPRGGVDEVAGHHPLVARADRHRGLAGQHAGAGLDARPEVTDGLDQLEGGANGPLGVVLVGDRRAPDGHHRVADELLDGAAVAIDDLARHVEVAGQQLPDGLRVAAFGERREPDEVREEDRDEAAFGDGCGLGPGRGHGRDGGRRARLVPDQPVAAVAAEPCGRAVRRATGRAERDQAVAAFSAELPPGLGRRSAGGTVHGWNVPCAIILCPSGPRRSVLAELRDPGAPRRELGPQRRQVLLVGERHIQGVAIDRPQLRQGQPDRLDGPQRTPRTA